jgi:hypothetical protein
MPTGTTTARTQTRAKAAAKTIKDAPVDEQPPAAEPIAEQAEPTTLPVANLVELVQDLQTAQDSDHDAIVGLSGEIGNTNAALKSVISQLAEIAKFREEQGAATSAMTENIRDLARMFGTLSGKEQARHDEENELGLTGEHIHAAMIHIMRDVTAVGKDANAPAKMGGYAYRKVDDIMNAAGASMRVHGVYIRPEVVANERKSWQSNRSLVTEVVLTMRYHWVSGVDGTSFDVLVVGEGRDNGDKATSKAQAMCYKTMLLQAMCIPLEDVTGFDVEREDTSGMVPDRQQPQRQQNTAYGYGHQPQESPGGQAHAQAQQAPPPPPDRQASSETPEEKAAKALTAARNANDLAALDRIENYARELGILQVMVENAQLQLHLIATRGILSGAMPGPARETADAPPSDEPPWDRS